jgi:ferritin-like metal-binding protein YciE
MSWYNNVWPFSAVKRAEEKTSTDEFRKRIAESHERTENLEAVAERLRANREKIHQRAKELIGEDNVVGRQPLKSTPG